MNIEVAAVPNSPNKGRGDLFEKLSKDLLEAQGYHVTEEIRFTGVELDLLCEHKVSGKQVYVECKAHKEKIGAPVLRQLLGTVVAYDYSEGWLVTTSEYGKEAKGFSETWKNKPKSEASKLSFYTPDNIVKSLVSASVICTPPKELAALTAGGDDFLGDWSLLICEFGRFWTVYTLKGGAPEGVLLFLAKSGKLVSDRETLDNISKLDSSIVDYDLLVGLENGSELSRSSSSRLPNVVEVQIGDSWEDYRPARPQDFIGRDSTQKDIIRFLSDIRDNKSSTRIFAITGNSGLGKSSLIAKIRERTTNVRNRRKFFTFAVDIRGAKNAAYIAASLLTCLKKAQDSGFGDSFQLQLTDPVSPLTSPSISRYLKSLEASRQVVCLVFDQFEELYSKPELFSVFGAAKDLFLEVASQKSNLVLGFAWKTDSTTQQDHPAYHIWHDLSDHRKVYKLDVFDKGEIAKAITTFEKEVDYKVPPELRHQITQSCQGFPWLLKKLCININENIKKGDESDISIVDIDVGRLFESDLESLSPQEHQCLKLVAQKAPADWSEVIEISGIGTINSLVYKRLIVKSGDRLNVYWDIFKDYLLTGKVPVVPFNYIPSSDLSSMQKVSNVLPAVEYMDAKVIAEKTGLREKTVWNIGADLVMLGLAERRGVQFKNNDVVSAGDDELFLNGLRMKFAKHALKLALFKVRSGQTVAQNYIKDMLQDCLPNATFSAKTWSIYTNRLTRILLSTGYLVSIGGQFVVQDTGSIATTVESMRGRGRGGARRRGALFSATASPASVCAVLDLLKSECEHAALIEKGYRNSLFVLTRFELISLTGSTVKRNNAALGKLGGVTEAVWTSAKNEPTIAACIECIHENPQISGPELGDFISEKYRKNWTPASAQRNGNGLRQWAAWVSDGISTDCVPPPPGRKNSSPSVI